MSPSDAQVSPFELLKNECIRLKAALDEARRELQLVAWRKDEIERMNRKNTKLLTRTLDQACQLGHFVEQIKGLGGKPEWKYCLVMTRGSSEMQKTMRTIEIAVEGGRCISKIEPTKCEIE